VCSGGPPGTVHLLDTGGTHAFGLAAAVELARALRRLPPRLVVVGVEASTFEYGAPLTAPVAAAVPAAVAQVLAVLEEVSARVPR
jgi:hydrogenase maturation protease